jgi:lipid II:glycine glycyltransferase (peptidoglycan interpeptide bridge formation enzyme)
VLKDGLGGQPLYFYLKDGGEIVAGLPGILLNFKIFKILYASIPYGHLIGEKSYYSAFLQLLEKEFRRKGIDQVRLAESPFSDSYPPESFKPIFAKCTLLDLRGYDKEKIWEGYRNEVKRAIRKAQKKGLYVKGATSTDEVAIFYRLYLSSMERNRTAAKYPLRWFDALYQILIEQKKADFLFAIKGDEYAAGVVLVYSQSSSHYLHNGSVEAYLGDRPNDLIVDYIIQQGVEGGKTTVDFMGSDPKDLALLRFKEKWGSQSKDVFTYVKDYHPFRCRVWELGRKLGNSRAGSLLIRLLRKG